jgi:hypothetical protein
MRGAVVAVAFALFAAPASAAEPIRLPYASPTLAGDHVLDLRGSDRAGYEIRATRLGGGRLRTQTIGHVPPRPRRGVDYSLRLAASDELLVFAQSAEVPQRFDPIPVFTELWTGPFGDQPALYDRCEYPPDDHGFFWPVVDGRVFAYGHSCGQRAQVTVVDETGRPQLTVDDWFGFPQLAGRYVAWGARYDNPQITLVDWVMGEKFLDRARPPIPGGRQAWLRGWSLQRDGKVALLYDRGDRDELGWFSAEEPSLHVVPDSDHESALTAEAPVRLAEDRLVYVHERDARCDVLMMTALDGRSWPIGCAETHGFDWNGRWVIWPEFGCRNFARLRWFAASPATIEGGLDPRRTPCPVELDPLRQTLAMTARGDRIRLRCPRGCEGGIELRLPGRVDGRPLARGWFEIERGSGRSSRIRLRDSVGRARTAVVWVTTYVDGSGDESDPRRIGRVRIVPL